MAQSAATPVRNTVSRFFGIILAVAGLMLATYPAASQVLPEPWQFGSTTQHDGRKYLASLRAAARLQGGDSSDGYAPTLVISCTERDPQHWQQQLILEEPLTSRGMITMRVRLDDKTSFDSQWVVTGNKLVATKVGIQDVARLASARTLKLQWNWGWSWLWLSDEAEFNLADIRTVLFVLAKSCAVPQPG